VTRRWRFARWTIAPAPDPVADPITHQMQCATCPETSPTSDEFEEARTWAFAHVGQHPTHTRFREVIHRTWTAVLKD
jgi:hypothetical protein